MSKVDLNHNPIIQSPYTYLQAAGSDGTDKTVKGNHLRWDFLKTLGDNHLAKGNYTLNAPYVSTQGFNRDNDFIKIFRTKFKNKFFVTVNFKVNQTTIVNSGTLRAWKYTLPVDSLSGTTTNVTVRFIDYAQYDIIRAAQATFNTKALLNAYTGIVEVETDNKLFFYAELDLGLRSEKTDYVRVESVTVPDTSDLTQKQVSCRKKFYPSSVKTVSCENIQYLRFDYVRANWQEIRIYCYEDYIKGINGLEEKGGWEDVGDFAITTDDVIASTRFMPNEIDGVNGHWPKFNDTNAAGQFTVNKQNYYDRWRRPGFTFNPTSPAGNDLNGLQHFIHTYMELSATDERALASIPSDTSGDPTTQNISYLDMIRLMSLDYHLARILGLGHIDGMRNLDKKPTIYCMEYKTYKKLETPYTTNAQRTHIYMTPPVAITDYKLPATPSLTPLTYGISVDNGTSIPTLLTDANGYAPFGNVRFININRGPFNFEKPFGPFYWDPTEFCLCDETQPVAYGLEYKEISEANFRKPEISHDTDYLDVTGIPETIPILEGGSPKIYTHQEEEEGTHEYRSYAINWFSRISKRSNPVTAATVFPKQSHLLPPFNFAVQLIQDEDPAETIPEKTLILTTITEQNLLAGLSAEPDDTLVRTTFDWNHVHHHAHQYADYAEIFFRRPEPLVVKGKISLVALISGNRAQINTGSYNITSTSPVTTITPTILSGDSAKFAGSFFSSGGENYVIESVLSSGANPTIIIKLIKQVTASADPAHPGQFISNETFKAPTPGDLFFTAENMGEPTNWDLRHSRRVYLEKFYTNAQVTLRTSATHTKTYDIKSVSLGGGGNTRVEVEKPISITYAPGLTLEYAVKHEIIAITPPVPPLPTTPPPAHEFTITGNHLGDFAPGKSFRVFANRLNDGLYTVASSALVSGNTVITVSNTLDASLIDGLIEVIVSRTITAINTAGNFFRLSGNHVAEIDAAHIEYKTETDGSVSRFVVGGITDTVTFTPLLTTPPPASSILPEGTGFIQVNFQNYDLLPHPDSDVCWYKGTIRLKDVTLKTQVYPVTYIGHLTTTPPGHLSVIIQDPGFIPLSAQTGPSPADVYTLNLSAPQVANFHPSYKLYLKADNGVNPGTGTPLPGSATNFDREEILPVQNDPTEGSRQTFMCIRAYDIKNDLESFLSNPVVLLAQKITLPLPPGKPEGPLYSTRPDFYGKSTYTFDTTPDTSGGRVPYSVVFYRASDDRVLDLLYKKETKKTILDDLEGLVDPLNPDAVLKHDPNLWKILFGGLSSGTDFQAYTISSTPYVWPLPDNDEFFLAYETNKALSASNPLGGHVFPFAPGFNFNFLTSTYTIYGKPWTPQQILKRAIQDAFISLTEQPPMFNYIKPGTITSSAKAKSRDASGNMLDPYTHDIFPMIRVLPGPAKVLRFTDYILDGASKSLYFYRALEMDDKFKFSEASLPVGPVLMVNAFPTDKPQIRKLLTQLQNTTTNTPTSVVFEINEYSANEQISKVEIYRATNDIDALSIRTMKKAKSIVWGDPLVDDFSDVAFPPYGEMIHYRIIAIREIEDVKDVLLAPAPFPGDPIPTQIIDMPSLPSNISKTNIVDVNNPPAPKLYSENGVATPTELQNVILKWNPTCYNGTYRLQKLNASGNWVEMYSVKVTDAPMQYPPLNLASMPDFVNYPETISLPRVDANGNAIYHRYRVQVENSSGLFNLSEYEITLAKGASDLQEIDSVLNYEDANLHSLSVLKTIDFITGASQPGSMTFTHLNGPLPAGHNTFNGIDITVTDDLGGSQTLSIASPGGTALFDSITAPALALLSDNRTYTVKTKLYTDFATNGAVQVFTINYLAGPAYDLSQITELVKLTDSNHDVDPLVSGNVNNGVAYPTQLLFTKIADLTSIGQTFNHMDITVTDDLGTTVPKTIGVADTDVLFTTADGLMLDNTNPNRSYEIKAKIFTDEVPAGHEIMYNISYTYTPCDDLTSLTAVAKYTDNNGTAIDPLSNQTITAVTHPNGSITVNVFSGITLPAGHTFDHMDVILEDDLGGAFIKTISAIATPVTFNHGDGGLVLNSSNPQRTYFVTCVLYTNLCSNGGSYTYTIKYQ